MTVDAGGTTFRHIYISRLAKMKLVIPGLDEQSHVLTTLAGEVRSIDDTTSVARRELALLGKYRGRLIADVVTGKLDVRNAAARLPDVSAEPERAEEHAASTAVETEEDEDLEHETAEADE
jgi:type I restriction enzyme S subunit